MPSDVSAFWDDLLLAAEEGAVVPFVGRELLVTDLGDGPELYHHLIARRLAEELGVAPATLPTGFDANDVICAQRGFHGNAEAVRARIVRLVRGLRLPTPEPLRMLAEIPAFTLYVSTTFDTLLEEAVLAVRGRPPVAIAFPAVDSLNDLDDSLLKPHGSVVFQVLGRALVSSRFAVTEGQVLELMHDFMTGPRRPDRLLAHLRERHLLLLGVSFPDWLARFFLRLARDQPLWDSRSLMEFVADNSSMGESLAVFLGRFSPEQSRLFRGYSPVDFVRELHRRWFERHPGNGRSLGSVPSSGERPAEMARGAVFISYASEDRGAAAFLAERLNAAGIETWMDRRLQPGDDYRTIIERYIRECAAIVPVLSRHTQSDAERWFRREWNLACDRERLYFGTELAFIFPVVVDATPLGELNEMRRETFRRTAVRAENGEPPAELIQQLNAAQRACRKQLAHT